MELHERYKLLKGLNKASALKNQYSRTVDRALCGQTADTCGAKFVKSGNRRCAYAITGNSVLTCLNILRLTFYVSRLFPRLSPSVCTSYVFIRFYRCAAE